MKRYEQYIELKLLCKIQVRGPLQENPGTSSHVWIYFSFICFSQAERCCGSGLYIVSPCCRSYRRGAVQDGDTCEKEWTLSSQLDPPGMQFTWYVKYNLNSSKFNGCVIHAEELNFDHGIWWNSQGFEKAKAATLIEKTNPLGPEVLDSKHHHAAPKKQPQLLKPEHARNGPRTDHVLTK